MQTHGRKPANRLPSPPLALARVIRIAGDPDKALAELARACEHDPGLTMELIRVANAARFAGNRPIKSVPQAVVKLGARAVRNHALTYALRATTGPCHTGGFDTRRFWEDSLRRGCAARLIAEALGDEDPAEAFAVGICQDLGTLLLAVRHPELGETLDDLRARPGEARRQAERVLSGRDHCQELTASPLIAMLPEEMRLAIEMHHAPQRGGGRAHQLARIAWAADRLSDVAQAWPKAVVLERVGEAFGRLGLGEDLRHIYADLRRQMAEDAAELAIPVSEQPTLAEVQDQARRAMQALVEEKETWSRDVQRQLQARRATGAGAVPAPARSPAPGLVASRDPLTALDNRRTFEGFLQRALVAAARHGEPLTLILGDLDHFKRLNDTRGLAIGDEVLRGVAQRLAGAGRDGDRAGRVGGEEFGVLLPATGPEVGRVQAERIRHAIGGSPLAIRGQQVPVTLSLGVATWHPALGPWSALELLERADQALHRAKRGGRDRVCVDELAVEQARAVG